MKKTMTIRLFYWVFLLFIILPISAEEGIFQTDIKALEWPDLIPKDWHLPIIAATPDEHAHIDPKSVNQSLANKKVKIPGFMIPLKVKDYKIVSFILVPFLKHHIKAHYHHEANQMIYISLQQPMPLTNPFQPWWITGVLSLDSVETLEGTTGYSIKNAQIEAYIY